MNKLQIFVCFKTTFVAVSLCFCMIYCRSHLFRVCCCTCFAHILFSKVVSFAHIICINKLNYTLKWCYTLCNIAYTFYRHVLVVYLVAEKGKQFSLLADCNYKLHLRLFDLKVMCIRHAGDNCSDCML